MKKFIHKILIPLALSLLMIFVLIGCVTLPGNNNIRIGDNGNWFIGDTDTGVPVRGEDGKDGKDGDAGLSAYEIYKKYYEYDGTEKEWLDDLIRGRLKTFSGYQSLSTGFGHTLYIDENGDLWAWGQNDYGQFGDGSKVNKSIPVQINQGTKYKAVSGGYNYGFAIDENDGFGRGVGILQGNSATALWKTKSVHCE